MLLESWSTPGRPLVVGHRGASGYAPENTLASFELALEQGADAVELDVHLSRDGEAIVIHDEQLERTTTGHGLVGEHTLAELRSLDAGVWFDPRFAGQRLPTLGEMLAWARGRTRLVIEIKNAPIFYHGIESAVVELVERYSMLESVLVISFDHHALQRVHELEPRILSGPIYACRPVDPVSLAQSCGARALAPQWSFVTPEDVAVAHAAGLAVSPWTADTPEAIQRLLDARVDAISTNYPDRVVGSRW
jgi:glycerophosphoryl diester phosphodiesterase